MGATTISGVATERVTALTPPLIERKAAWSDDWQLDQELEFVVCRLQAGAAGMCELRRRYGHVKYPCDSDLALHPAVDYRGHWIRLSLAAGGAGGDGAASADDTSDGSTATPAVIFLGQVETQSAILVGGDGTAGEDSGPAGQQLFVATGGLRVLERMIITQAHVRNANGSLATIGWVPPMNKRDPQKEGGALVGNRSTVQMTGSGTDESYVYGGPSTDGGGGDLWSHLDYLTYLVTHFIQTPPGGHGASNGPLWTIGGQSDILVGMTSTVEFGQAASAHEMLKQLIPVRYGVDFCVVPTDAGFEIRVFALTSKEVTNAGIGAGGMGTGGAILPANDRPVILERTSHLDFVMTQIADTIDKRYDRVQVLGKRIVVCGTLRADAGELVPKWSDALEAAYAAADDKERQSEKYRQVFQRFGAPADWNMSGWQIGCDDAGNPITAPTGMQNQFRETLGRLPFKLGFDYSTTPPTDHNLPGVEPELNDPMVWIKDMEPVDGSDPGLLVPATQAGHIGKPLFDWGIVINASPNHLLAWGRPSQVAIDASIDENGHPARFDASSMVATIALESDQRLGLSYALPEKLQAGDGSVMTVMDEQAELWVGLAGTMFDCDGTGTPSTLRSFTVLRNDKDRLTLLLAGLVARYIQERVRARFVFKGYIPWADLLGAMLTVYQQGDMRTDVGAAITSIEWRASRSPETMISTGYA